MTAWPIPSAEDQLLFLKHIQRLLTEGSFVASYKFALLHALADLAVLKGDDTGAPLVLSTEDIGERFVQLYWQQSRPFHVTGEQSGVVLKHNTGPQAAVINKIVQAQSSCGGSLYRFQQDRKAWQSLVREVAGVVRVMPLWKLQTVGSERLDFLYDNTDKGRTIELKPGVAYCLRAFHPVLCNLFRSAWIDYLRRHNQHNLGETTDIHEFLFGHERTSLDPYRSVLRDIQRNQCFYCGRSMRASGDVDHFIPWSRCRSDLGHNLVLAHRGCNNAKSDHLAFEQHLEAWVNRNRDLGPELVQRLDDASLIHSLPASSKIAEWAYAFTEQTDGQVWIRGKEFKRLGPK